MKKVMENKFTPYTSKDVIETTKTVIRKDYPNNQIMRIYLSGSRLRNLHDTFSDFDVFAIVMPTIDSILSGSHLSKHIVVNVLNWSQNVDVHIVDLLQLRTELLKGSINWNEMLNSEPLFDNDMLNSITWNNTNKLNQSKMVSSVLGISNNILKEIQKDKRFKDVSLSTHFTELVSDIINGKTPIVEASNSVSKQRKRADDLPLMSVDLPFSDSGKSSEQCEKEIDKFKEDAKDIIENNIVKLKDLKNNIKVTDEKSEKYKKQFDKEIWNVLIKNKK